MGSLFGGLVRSELNHRIKKVKEKKEKDKWDKIKEEKKLEREEERKKLKEATIEREEIKAKSWEERNKIAEKQYKKRIKEEEKRFKNRQISQEQFYKNIEKAKDKKQKEINKNIKQGIKESEESFKRKQNILQSNIKQGRLESDITFKNRQKEFKDSIKDTRKESEEYNKKRQNERNTLRKLENKRFGTKWLNDYKFRKALTDAVYEKEINLEDIKNPEDARRKLAELKEKKNQQTIANKLNKNLKTTYQQNDNLTTEDITRRLDKQREIAFKKKKGFKQIKKIYIPNSVNRKYAKRNYGTNIMKRLRKNYTYN